MTRQQWKERGDTRTDKGRNEASRQRRHRLLSLEPLEPRLVLDGLGLDDYGRVSEAWFGLYRGLCGRPSEINLPGPADSPEPASPASRVAAQTVVDRWLVQLRPDAVSGATTFRDVEQLLRRTGTQYEVLRGLGLPGLVEVYVAGRTLQAVSADLGSHPLVASFSPDIAILGPQGDPPNDGSFNLQWALRNTGQTGGTAGADIDALPAWDVTTGSTSTVVGIVDSGLDYTHEDLYRNVWINQREIPAAMASQVQPADGDGLITFRDLNAPQNAGLVTDANANGYIDGHDLLHDPDWADGVDNEGNHFRDDLIGWDFQGEDNDPYDAHGHGTHVAGIIAAVGNNTRGVSGVNWAASLMPLRYLNESNRGQTSDAILALNYATLMRQQFGANVRVTNNSWGRSGEASPELRAAIQASAEADILFVAAAGNGNILGRGVDNDVLPFYPASFDLPNIVSVTASDLNDALAMFSNYGLTSVDLAAPGVGILSTEPHSAAQPLGNYSWRNGTSMAAPFVTGVAALIASKLPDATADEIRQAILQGVDVVPALNNRVATDGRLSALGALTADTYRPRVALQSAADVTEAGGTVQEIRIAIHDNSDVKLSRLDGYDLVVTSLAEPGEPIPANLVYTNPAQDAPDIVAVYRITAPGGTWDPADNGSYTISLLDGAIEDIHGNTAAAAVLGTFSVNVPNIGQILVDSLDDNPDANLVDGISDDGSGHSTLRAAIMQANHNVGLNTIVLPAGTFTLTRTGAGEDAAVTGDLDVTDQLTIFGAREGGTIIDASGLDRVLDILGDIQVELQYVTLRHGQTPAGEGGGAIRNAGRLTLVGSRLTGSQAYRGGGIENSGRLTMTASTVDANAAETAGGGLYHSGSQTVSITNSTFSGNQATVRGGGIDNSGPLQLASTTVAYNVTQGQAGGVASTGTAYARNTLIAANTAASSNPDVQGAFTSLGNNLVGDTGAATGFTDGVNGDLVGHSGALRDPHLGPLADYGGLTPTHILLAASPAVNAGTFTDAPATDQRGVRRPTAGEGYVDIGAYERRAVEIHGVQFHDANSNGVQDAGETGLAGWTIYLDLNQNGQLDAGEPSTISAADNPATTELDETGQYAFTDLEPGRYTVRELPQKNFTQTFPRDLMFTSSGTVNVGLAPSAVAAADLNRDGFVDLAVANRQGNSVSLLFNQRDGSFEPGGVIPAGTAPIAVAVALVNSDSVPDLIVAHQGSAQLTVLLNQGYGTFVAGDPIAVTGTALALVAADFNGDSRTDVALLAEGSPSVQIWLSDGAGHFAAAPSVAVGEVVTALTAADLDSDGDQDLLVLHRSEATLRILTNNGQAGFTVSEPIFAGGSDPSAVVAAELSGDGRLDVAVANQGSDTVSVMLNQGNGTLGAAVSLPVGPSPLAILASDWNSDGAVDLATLNAGNNTLSVLLSQRDTSHDIPGQDTGLTLTVNSTADKIDLSPGDGVVDTGTPGEVTLRAAIMETNAFAGADTIILPAGTYALSLAGAGEDGAETGDLDITKDQEDAAQTLTILGAGAASTFIDGADLDRVFHVLPGVTLNLSGVNVSNGQLAASGNGGGILNDGTLVLADSAVTDNQTNAGSGGGIASSGTLTVTGTTVSGNTASGGGGGTFVSSGALMTMTESTLAANTAASGAGLANAGTVYVVRSTISGNMATTSGAGLWNDGGAVELTNSTVSGNQVTGGGDAGGIENRNSGTLTLVNATIANNSAASGGGIKNTAGTANLHNTLIATNLATVDGPDASGAFTSQGHNLLSIGDGSTGLVNGQSGDKVGTLLVPLDARLGSLADNGGPTWTHLPLPGSPAIDAGDNTGAPATDQRGLPRVADGDGNGAAVADIGAVERYYGQITGLKFHDRDRNGVRAGNGSEPALAGWTMYLDLNANREWDAGEPSAVTRSDDPGTPGVDETGTYALTNVPPGTYRLAEVPQAGWVQTAPLDPGFLAPTALATAAGTWGVAAADFDVDGDDDLAFLVDGETDYIAIRLNQRDGTFAPAITYPADGVYFHTPAVADLNGDGKPDLVVAGWGTHKVWVLLNHGDGSFGTPAGYSVGQYPQWVQTGDFDGDGDEDVVVAHWGSSFQSLLWNQGNGTFAAAVNVTLVANAEFLVAMDYDLDNDLDLVATVRGSGNLVSLKNDGTGSFSVANTRDWGNIYYASPGDFDADGDLDLALVGGSNAYLTVLRNNRNGTFDWVTEKSLVDDAYVVQTADLDRDGDVDLVWPSKWDGKIGVLWNSGSGSFSNPEYFNAPDWSEADAIAVADANGDGAPDLVVPHGTVDTWILLNDPGDTYTVSLYAGETESGKNFGNYSFNRAPVLADTELDVLLPLTSDANLDWGTLVSNLVGGITDADAGAVTGIAITAADQTNGTLQYTLDGGTTWQNVDAVSNSSALLLPDDANTRLRFRANAGFTGPVTSLVTFRAWDQTEGTAGQKHDTTFNGLNTAFSTATDTVTALLTAVFWDGGGDDGLWNTPANWNGDTLPTSANAVLIDTAGTPTVTVSANVQVSALWNEEALSITAGSMTVTARALFHGSLSMASDTALQASGNTADVNVTGVTQANGAHFYAVSGGRLSVPGLLTYQHVAPNHGAVRNLQAQGAGSILDLPNLTSIEGGSVNPAYVDIQALDGAEINLAGVTTISAYQLESDGGVRIKASGEGSLVDLSALTTFHDNRAKPQSLLEEYNGGEIRVPNLQTAAGMGLYASAGQTLSLPALRALSIGTTRCDASIGVQAVGAGAVVDLPAMTSVDGSGCAATLTIRAASGGRVDLPAVVQMNVGYSESGGGISVVADGVGSVVDLSALVDFLDTRGFPASSITQSSGGSVRVGSLAHVAGVDLIAVAGETLTLPALTKFSEGGTRYGGTGSSAIISATGPGAAIDAPNLQTITGSDRSYTSISLTASGGGRLNLRGVTQIESPSGMGDRGIYITAAGDGSEIDLSALEGLKALDANSIVSVGAESGGQIQLGPSTAATDLVRTAVVAAVDSLLAVGNLRLDPWSSLSGRGVISGNLINKGTLRVGTSPGVLTIDGDYTQTATGSLHVEIGGIIPGDQYDRLVVTGKAKLDGTLAISTTGGFTPSLGHTFRVLTADAVSGKFAAVTGQNTGSGRGQLPVYGSDNVTLQTVFYVNNTADTVDASPGNGTVADAGGNATLRAAIMEANARAGDDTIILPAGTYTLSLAGAGEDGAATGDLDITKDQADAAQTLTILGAGAASTFIDGADLDRIFQVLGGATLNLSGVTVRNGRLAATGDGGGMLNEGTLALTDSIVTGHETTDGYGGGIFSSGNLTISGSSISSNTAAGHGGGLASNGVLNVTDTTFSSNTAYSGGGVYADSSSTAALTRVSVTQNSSTARGGGIALASAANVTLTDSTVATNTSSSDSGGGVAISAGTLHVIRSTISGNTAASYGGGIENEGGAVDLTGSTVSGNQATNAGGGIENWSNGTLTLTNATVSDNTASLGGGINDAAGTVTLKNTILAGNNATTSAPDVSGVFTSEGHNLIVIGDGSTGLVNAQNGDQVGTLLSPLDAKLGPLGNNGGPTQTHALLAGSPAIDAGDNTDAAATDQRGVPRVLDGNGDGTITVDIGAVEYINGYYVNSTADSVDANLSDGQALDSQGRTTLRAAIQQANATAGPQVVFLPAGTYTLTIPGAGEDAAATGDLDITDDLTLIGAGAQVSIIDANQLDRALQLSGTVGLQHLGITGGHVDGDGGGGIYASGAYVNLDSVAVFGNISVNGSGGGLVGRPTIRNSRFENNSAGNHGGAIAGFPQVEESVFINNQAAFDGGAISVEVNDPGYSWTVQGSTFAGNHAGRSGGAIRHLGAGQATATFSRTTFSGNTAAEDGGAIDISMEGNILTLRDCTVVDNEARRSGGVGINEAHANAQNSIIAANRAGTHDDLSGAFTSLGHNLIGDLGTATGFADGEQGDIVGGGGNPVVDPILGPLQDNGGPTWTHAPLRTSPVIDAGSNTGAPATDQRGALRIVDGNVDGVAAADIGAVEFGFLVNTTDDTVDADPGDGFARDANGRTSLRAAVMEANASSGKDAIILPAGHYGLSLTGTDDDAVTGDLDICGELTITGSGADATTIDAQGIDRVFDVFAGTAVGFWGLTITGGDTTVGNFHGAGIRNTGGTLTIVDAIVSENVSNYSGGLYTTGPVTITRSEFSDNVGGAGTSASGGAIYLSGAGAQVAVSQSTFTANYASSKGGAIYVYQGALSVDTSTFQQNTAFSSGGGAIRNDGGTVVVETSLFRANSADGGGAIHSTGTLSITSSTFSGNTASLTGGTIYNYGGDAVMRSSTVTLGDSVTKSAGGVATGGPVESPGTFLMQNTIIAGNTDDDGSPDVLGDFTSLGNNLIRNVGTATGFTQGLNGDIVGGGGNPLVNAQLGPLQDNGGPTWTHALLSNSPAIDAGQDEPAIVTDQRGAPRSLDGDADGSRVPDIGAVEYFDPGWFFVDSFDDTVDANPGDGVVADHRGKRTLRAAVLEANATPGPNTIVLSAGRFELSIPGPDEDDGRTGDLDIFGSGGALTFIGTGAATSTIDANQLDRVLQLSVTVGLQHLGITGGHVDSYGGGIYAAGAYLNLDSVAVFGNISVNGSGGGLLGRPTIRNSRFENNSAGNHGGAIAGFPQVEDSVFINNQAAFDGGAISVEVNDPGYSWTIQGSTFAGNYAGRSGGAIRHLGAGQATATFSRTTFSGNTAAEDGGAIDISMEGNILTLKDCTVVDNEARRSGGVRINEAHANAQNSIIAANRAGIHNDLWGAFTSLGHNLIGDLGTATGFVDGEQGDIVGGGGDPVVDPILGPLQDNGGPTWTRQPLVGSPAIDKGDSNQSVDQRGVSRRLDGDNDAAAIADIGAVEHIPPSWFFVDSFEDTVDANPGDGIVADIHGKRTLRAAIQEANARTGDQTLVLLAGRYTLSRAGTGETAAATGDLNITDTSGSVTIIGAGADLTFIDANSLDRVFDVGQDAALNLTGVTVTGGRVTGANYGAGIWVFRGDLSMHNAKVSGNWAADRGGGIYSYQGTLTIDRSVISNNVGGGDGGTTLSDCGGGLYGYGGQVTISQSTVSGNSAHNGAGLYLYDGTGLTLTASAVIGNTATGSGGGLAVYNPPAVTITNSTFSGNTAGVFGGAIDYGGVAGSMTIVNSTITANTASNSGGGIYAGRAPGLQNTLVAGNVATNSNPDIAGSVTTLGHNLIGDVGTATGIANGVNGDIVGGNGLPVVDPLIGPLQDNGGPTLTHVPLPGSPLIDAGDNTGAPATDQVGIPRPQDGNGDGTATVDIGAVERYSGEIRGRVNQDLNQDGLRDAGEPGLAVRTVFIDVNNNGQWDTGEQASVTLADDAGTPGFDESGLYALISLPPGHYVVAAVLPVGWEQTAPTAPGTKHEVDLYPGQIAVDRDFGHSVTLSIDDPTLAAETNTGSTTLTFTVSLSAASLRPVTVQFATAAGTATDDADYQSTSGSLTFDAGQTSKPVSVTVLGDLLDEFDETVLVVLSGAAGARIAKAEGVGTITDDEALPRLTIDDVTLLPEGDLESSTVQFTITLTPVSGRDVWVDYATHPNTATAGSDFLATAGTLHFAAGETTKTVTVEVLGDFEDEPAEDFFVDLSAPVNADIQDGQGLGTIVDDDPLLTVNSLLDKADLAPGNGAVDTGTADEITLRAAIMEANALPGADWIILPAGTYRLTIAQAGENAGAKGDLDIIDTTGSLTIAGAGSNVTVIDADGLDRVVQVLAGASLQLIGVTVRGGHAAGVTSSTGGGLRNSGTLTLIDCRVIDNEAEDVGGGIDNSGTLTLTRTTLSGNSASEGGGIHSLAGATLTITDSVLQGNAAAQSGGAIIADGTIDITRSVLQANTAVLGGAIVNAGRLTIVDSTLADNVASGQGGVLFNGADFTAPVQVSGSTFVNNQAAQQGGALYLGSEGSVAVVNSTFTQNRSARGGAVYNAFGSLTLTNVTVAGNAATGAAGQGGGLSNAAAIELRNTLVAQNTASASAPDVDGAFTSLGYNLIGDSSGSTGFTHGVNGDQAGTGSQPILPLLLALADNGGPTWTMALLPGSPAVDAGSNQGAPAVDQCGTVRPEDGELNGQAVVDIGAVELTHNLPPEIDDQTWFVDENVAAGTLIGIVQARGPEADDVVTLSLVSGNVDGTFALDPHSGRLTLAGSLNHESLDVYSLTVRGEDLGHRTVTATIVVRVNDLNEPPFLIGSGIDDRTRADGSSTETLNLATVFGDVDAGEVLTFTAVSSNPALVSVQVLSGNLLEFTYPTYAANQNRTPATVTVRATDVGGLFVSDVFTVTVTPTRTFEYVLVAVAQPTPQDEVTTLPTPLSKVALGDAYYAEIWVRDLFVPGLTSLPGGVTSDGVEQGAVDVTFLPSLSEAVRLDHKGIFDFGPGDCGDIMQALGRVENFGGKTLVPAQGVTPSYGRLGFVELVATAQGEQVLGLELDAQLLATMRSSVVPADGTIHPSQIRLAEPLHVSVVPEGGSVPFAPAVQLATGTTATAFAAADLDADGDPDMVVADGAGNRVLLLQNTPGFSHTVTVHEGEVAYGVAFGVRPAAGQISGRVYLDLNQNGLRDVVEPGLDDAVVYLDADGDGQRDDGEPSRTTDATGDYAFTNLPTLTTYIVRQVLDTGESLTAPSGDGSWTVPLTPGQAATGLDFGNVVEGGVSNSRILGLVFLDTNDNGLQDADEPDLPGETVYLDVNDNGQWDNDEPKLTTQEDLPGTPSINEAGTYEFQSLGAGVFPVRMVQRSTLRQTYPLDSGFTTHELVASDGPRSIALGYFDTDSKPDLAVANIDTNTVSVFSNPGQSGSTTSVKLTVGLGPASLIAGDWNGDTFVDLAVANNYSGDVSLLRNQGGGVFSAATAVAAGIGPRAIVAGDFNGDQALDLATANDASNNVAVLLNDGQGVFATRRTYLTDDSPVALITADLNRDGHLDLAAANIDSNNVTLLMNDGLGNFAAVANLAVGTAPFALTSADFNQDGRADLAVANILSDDITVLLNTGAGWAMSLARFPTNQGPTSLAATDLDFDGDVDLVVTSGSSATLSVLRNRGDGTFEDPTSFGQANFAEDAAYAVLAADLDRNGFADLAVANGRARTISVLMNDPLPAAHEIVLTDDRTVSQVDFGVTPVSSPPVVEPATFQVPEGSPAGTLVGTVVATDPNPDDSLTFVITAGNPGGAFVIGLQTGVIRTGSGQTLDFEAQSTFDLTVQASDGRDTGDATITVQVTDVNEPASVSLTDATATLPECLSNPARRKVAEIVVSDDALGSNTMSLSGADAALFEIVSTDLYLKAGAALDAETNPVLDVTVAVDDPTVGVTPDATTALAITVTPTVLVPWFEATRSGFTVRLNHDLVPTVLNLYDQGGVLGPADVTVTGATVGPVRGSLVVAPDLRGITFIKTGGVLAADTYTVTLVSGANAFRDAAGNLLDGNGDGTGGDNYTATFVVPSPAAGSVTASLPDFARGYGQPVNLPANVLTAGVPLQLSEGLGVSRLQFTLRYDPGLLEVQAFTLGSSLVERGGQAQFQVVSPGTATLNVTVAGGFADTSGPLTVGTFTAVVPATAAYGAKHVLDITDLHLFDTAGVPAELPAVDDDAIHVAAFFGDNNGSRTYNAPDVTLNQRLIGLINTGFSAYQLADPLLLADITRNGQMQANDTVSIQRVIGQVPVANVPALPTGLTPPAATGADPRIYIPQDLSGSPGDTVEVPVMLLVTEAAGITLSGFDLAIEFDPARFTVSDVQLGSLVSGLDFVGLWTNPAPDQLLYTASSATGTGLLLTDTEGSLAAVKLTIGAGAAAGPAAINLLASFQTTATAAFDNELNELVLAPAPSNAADDSVDGLLRVQSPPSGPPPAQNPDQPLDTNDDGGVSAADVVAVINYLNLGLPQDASVLYVEPGRPITYGDVNGDRRITAQDALAVINDLNAHLAPGGEGEAHEAALRALLDEGEEDEQALWELLAEDQLGGGEGRTDFNPFGTE